MDVPDYPVDLSNQTQPPRQKEAKKRRHEASSGYESELSPSHSIKSGSSTPDRQYSNQRHPETNSRINRRQMEENPPFDAYFNPISSINAMNHMGPLQYNPFMLASILQQNFPNFPQQFRSRPGPILNLGGLNVP